MPANKAAVVHGIDSLLPLIPKPREASHGSLPLLCCHIPGQLLKDRFPHCPVEGIGNRTQRRACGQVPVIVTHPTTPTNTSKSTHTPPTVRSNSRPGFSNKN